MSFKKILSNQSGVSLIEVIAASAISIIIAMGVMQINENASKGMKDIQAQSDILGFKQMVRARLSQKTETINYCLNSITSAIGTTDISVDRNIGTQLNTTLASEPEFVIGEQVLSAPQWRVVSAKLNAFNNTSGIVGECNLVVTLEKRNKREADGSGKPQSSGIQARTVEIPLTCTIDDTSTSNITSCSPRMETGGAGESWWGTSTETAGTALTFEGIQGNPMVKVGPVTGTGSFGSGYLVTAVMTLDPLKSGTQDWSSPPGAVGTPTHALALPLDSAITFGDADELGLYSDAPNTNRLVLANSTNTAELLVGTSTSGTLIGQQKFYTQGVMGVGIQDPEHKLDVMKNFNGVVNESAAFIGGYDAGFAGRTGLYVVSKNNTGLNAAGTKLVDVVLNTISQFVITGQGRVGIGVELPSYHLHVNGDVAANNYYYNSDERFKKDIHTIEGASDKLSELRGVTYFMRKDEFPERRFPEDMQYGLIAQEVEKIFPELVKTAPSEDGEEGYKSVQYANLVAVLIEAFKEQKDEIIKNRELLAIMQNGMTLKDTEQDSRIEILEAENKTLRSRIEKLERAVEELIKNKED